MDKLIPDNDGVRLAFRGEPLRVIGGFRPNYLMGSCTLLLKGISMAEVSILIPRQTPDASSD